MGFTLENFSFGYEKSIHENLNLIYSDKKWHFIVGSTGTGKSTFIQTITKLLNQKSGKILYLGKNLDDKKNLKDFRNKSGIMFQYTEKQFFNHTIREEIIYNLKKREKKDDIINQKLEQILKLLSISENFLERSPFELSGGQKRMVALASILITEPEVLILDEPTVGLDTESKKIFFSVIKKLKENGVTIFQISHYLEDVLEYGDTVTIFSKNRVDYYQDTQILLQEEVTSKANLEPPEILEILNIFKKYNFQDKISSPIKLIEKLRAVKYGKI